MDEHVEHSNLITTVFGLILTKEGELHRVSYRPPIDTPVNHKIFF